MSEPAAALETALSDRYVVERELGRGGMATVYLARDLKHKRQVALKVLDPELGAVLGRERFLREIETAAQLQHPHILPVFDSGEAAGLLWYTMPFVDGESLRERIRREGRLPIPDAVELGKEIAAALDYAHRKGVIHRDIKPENVLLSDGRALVADFGIARTTAVGDGPALTQTGLSLGTPAYMSPEQALGQRDLDGRSDIYALGCVVYELLAGTPPYAATTAQGIVAKHISEPIPVLHLVRPDVPAGTEAAVTRAMAKTPGERFASAAEFAEALSTTPIRTGAPTIKVRDPNPAESRNRVLFASVGLATIAVALLAVGAYRRSHHDAGIERLAVLPFDNMGDSTESYFADGMTDAVRDHLAEVPGLQVIASPSASQYRGSAKPVQQIGHELGARYLLLGKVRWSKQQAGVSRVQVRPELIDASNGAERWGQSFDAALTDVFQVQGDIAGRVASALDLALGHPERAAFAQKPTSNLDAYDLYLRANALVDVGYWEANTRAAIALYDSAVALDSNFALAYARLATMRSFAYRYYDRRPEQLRAAKLAIDRAQALAGSRPEVQRALGTYYEWGLGNLEEALSRYKRAHALDPNDYLALFGMAEIEEVDGHLDDAVTAWRQAATLNPTSGIVNRRLGDAYEDLRNYEEAERAFDRSLALEANAPDPYIEKAELALLRNGDTAGVRRLLTEAVERAGTTQVAIAVLGYGASLFAPQLLPPVLGAVALPATSSDSGGYYLFKALHFRYQPDTAGARAYADSARIALGRVARASPEDLTVRVRLALAEALSNDPGRALSEIRGVKGALAKKPKMAAPSAYALTIAKAYVLLNMPDSAVNELEHALSVPTPVSRAQLRADPWFAPLRRNPRFDRLVSGT